MKELPVSVRRAIELVGLYTCGLIIVVGSGIIAPIVMAFLISIVIFPVYSFFAQKKLPESLSIALSLIILNVNSGRDYMVFFIPDKPAYS
ncbi:MAG: hypothetical protein WKG06_18965 [Segetibacter sp.]